MLEGSFFIVCTSKPAKPGRRETKEHLFTITIPLQADYVLVMRWIQDAAYKYVYEKLREAHEISEGDKITVVVNKAIHQEFDPGPQPIPASLEDAQAMALYQRATTMQETPRSAVVEEPQQEPVSQAEINTTMQQLEQGISIVSEQAVNLQQLGILSDEKRKKILALLAEVSKEVNEGHKEYHEKQQTIPV